MTVVEELTQVKAELDAAKLELDATKIRLEATIKDAATLIGAANKERDELKALMTGTEVKNAESLKAAQDAMAAEQAAHTVTKTELDTVKKALANPAFANAAVKGDEKAVKEGGGAVSASDEFATQSEALDAYRKIEDPKERESFRKVHSKILGLSK